MTFRQFEATVNHFRKDVIVSQHGDYCSNKSKNTLGIIFIKDGKQSKVYSFSGTYEEVLSNLNITEYYTEQDIVYYQKEIERLTKENGEKSLFKKEIIDNTEKIKQLKQELQYKMALYKAC